LRNLSIGRETASSPRRRFRLNAAVPEQEFATMS